MQVSIPSVRETHFYFNQSIIVDRIKYANKKPTMPWNASVKRFSPNAKQRLFKRRCDFNEIFPGLPSWVNEISIVEIDSFSSVLSDPEKFDRAIETITGRQLSNRSTPRHPSAIQQARTRSNQTFRRSISMEEIRSRPPIEPSHRPDQQRHVTILNRTNSISHIPQPVSEFTRLTRRASTNSFSNTLFNTHHLFKKFNAVCWMISLLRFIRHSNLNSKRLTTDGNERVSIVWRHPINIHRREQPVRSFARNPWWTFNRRSLINRNFCVEAITRVSSWRTRRSPVTNKSLLGSEWLERENRRI